MSILGECSAMPDKRQEIRDKKESTPLTPPLMFEKFWEIYPKTRREPKAKVLPAYLKALKITTEETIYEATRRYAASDEVARGFGKGTIAWLNAARWTVDYGATAAQGAGANARPNYGDSLENASRLAANFIEREEQTRRNG